MKFTCTVRLFLSVSAVLMLIPYPQIAKGQQFVDPNEGQYVDAPIGGAGLAGGGNTQSPAVAGASWDQNDQINTGILNYGLSESIYYQFSGEEIFEDGNPLSGGLALNWNWTHLNQLDYKIPPAWSYGGEFLYFSSTSDSTYSGGGSVSGSDINMNLYMLSMALKAFFMDPVNEFLQPYWGAGWGIFWGDFDTTQNITGSKHETSFSGVLSYQVFGIQIMFLKRGGIMAEIKNMRAKGATSNDPFKQGNGGSVDLNLDGVIIGLTGFYRF